MIASPCIIIIQFNNILQYLMEIYFLITLQTWKNEKLLKLSIPITIQLNNKLIGRILINVNIQFLASMCIYECKNPLTTVLVKKCSNITKKNNHAILTKPWLYMKGKKT